MAVKDTVDEMEYPTEYWSEKRMHAPFMVCHKAGEVRRIQEIVREFEPEMIVEFGYKGAGLTVVLRDAAPEAKIWAFGDNERGNPSLSDGQWMALSPNMMFLKCDLLSDVGHPIYTMLTALLRMPKRKLLYCDNGDKAIEMQMWGAFLQRGDLLGCHDWGRPEAGGATPETVAGLLTDFDPYHEEMFEGTKFRSRFWIRK